MANSTPIYSSDLYQPGQEDTLRKLIVQLQAIQDEIREVNAAARGMRDSLKILNAANNPQKVVAAATEQQRIHNEKQRLAVKQQLTLEKMRQTAAAQTAAAVTKSEQQQRRELEKTKQAMIRSQIAANSLEKSKIQLANASKRTGSSFTGLLGSLRNLTYAYFSLSAAQQIVGKLFSETKALNTLDMAFKQTLGSIQQVAEAKEFLIDITSRYGADLLTASNAYLKFGTAAKQAGVSAKDTNDIFESFTKASSVLGLGAERTSYVFLALEQIMSKGRLSTEELRRQLGEHLPGAFGIAAQAMGVTTAKLTDMLKKGQIASTDFLPKFAKQIEIAYGIENVKKVDNLAAAQGRFNNEVTLLIRDLDVANAFKDFFDSMANGVRFVRENAEAFLSLGKAIVYVVTAWGAWKLGAAIEGITSLRKAMIALNAAMKANPIGVIATAVIALVGVVDLLVTKIDAATISKKAFNDATNEGIDSTKLLKVQTDQLAAAYANENTSAQQKEKILKQLNALGIEATDINKDGVISTDELTDAIYREIAALQLRAETKALENNFDQIVAQETELRNKKTFDDGGQSILAGVDSFFGTTLTTVGKNKALAELDKAKKEIEAKLRDLYKLRLNGPGEQPDPVIPTKPPGGDGVDSFDPIKERLDLIFNDQERELAILKHAYEEKRKLFIVHNEDTTKLDQKYRDDRVEILNKYIDLEQKALQDAADRQRDLDAKEIEAFTKSINERAKDYKLARDRKEAERKNNVDALRDEFEARRKHEKEIFDLSKHTSEETNAFELRMKEQELNDEIQLHRIFGKVLSDEELARAIELRDKIRAELGKDGKGSKKDKKDEEIDIFSLLGINFKDEKAKDAAKEALDFAKSQITDFLDFQKEIIDQQIEDADRLVRAKEENLNRQIALAAANQANNVAGAQAELALAKKTQEDALKQRQKFQKTELALNTALEASNLGVAIAKTLAALPGLGGIALVTLMLGAFAAAKIKAFQLINKKTFRKGGFEEIKGGSHESGRDTHVGGNNWAEKDESVGIFNAKATRKYKPTLKAFVNAANKGVLEQILIQDRRAIHGMNFNQNVKVDTSVMEKRLGTLVSLSQKQSFVDGQGRLNIIDRGRKTIVK